jgi:4-hydroxybenzoate polyprenyltransferase
VETRPNQPSFLGQTLTSLRVLDWLHFLSFPVAGWFIDGAQDLLRLAAAIAAATLLLANAFAFNNFHDMGGQRSPWWHRIPLALAVAPLALLPWTGVGAAVAFVVISTTYSGPPRLKRLPVVGTLLNATGFPALCLLSVRRLSLPTVSLTGLAGCWMASAQLIHEGAHRADDQAGGLKTTGILLGSKWTRVVAVLLLALAAPLAWQVARLAGVAFVIYTVAVAGTAVFFDESRLRRPYKLLGLCWALVVGVGMAIPWLKSLGPPFGS